VNRLTYVLAAAFALGQPAAACPLCDSDTGRQVRANLFGPDFGTNLATVLLPFPGLLAMVVLVRAATPGRQKSYEQPS
jgi:hypothetical protein